MNLTSASQLLIISRKQSSLPYNDITSRLTKLLYLGISFHQQMALGQI